MNVAKKLEKKSIDEKLLKKLVPLNALTTDRLRELAEKAELENPNPGYILFKHGDTDAKTYFLLAGELEVQLPGGQNVSVKANTPAALHPLLDTRPRPATVVVKTNSTLLAIDTGLLDILVNYDRHRTYEVAEIHSQDESDWLTRFLQSLSAMNIPVKNIEHLMQRMREVPVRVGETVIRQTDSDSQHYYVIKEGRCVVTKQASTDKTAHRIAELTAGIGFGEEALLAEQPRNASITMLTDGRLMLLTKADFTQLIADPALHYVSYAQAQQMVQSGAIWLDTRSTAEYHDKTITGSMNFPLMALRTKTKELNSYGKYITFCDTGNRAATAAFLLRQMGFSAYVLTDGLRDVPAAALHGNTAKTVKPLSLPHVPQADPQAHKIPGQLKVRSQDTDNVDDTVHQQENVNIGLKPLSQAGAGEIRTRLVTAHAGEQDASIRGELETAKAERAQMRQRIAELEANNSNRDQALAGHREQARKLQAQVEEYTLNITAMEAAYNSLQKELDTLAHTHGHVTEKLKHENLHLQARVAVATSEIEHVKNELERAVERNRTAEEALHGAEREIARLKAEADAAQRSAEESLRRASESESLQSALLKEVQRKIEAAELMRLEAEEQAQRLHEAAELSRKRAEQESRKVAEAEAARAKAQDESERRERLAEEIRKKAESDMARLKKEADIARMNADEARKKSQQADAARRRLEQEVQSQQAQARMQPKPVEKPTAPPAGTPAVENDLDELERELAQLQQKLEAKKHAAVTRNQQVHQAVEKSRTAEPEIVQNVYDLHQKTQKLPSFKPNQPPPNDVGKVRKSGWISDSILWETTIGLREDSQAEQFLDEENIQRAAQPPAPHQAATTAHAVSSGEFKAQEAKRSVFTSRESAPVIQRHIDVPNRGLRRGHVIALLSAGAMVVAACGYIMLHKNGNLIPQSTTGVLNSTPMSTLPENTPPAAASQTKDSATTGTTKSTPSTTNGAITRKEALSPSAVLEPVVAKPKADAGKLSVRQPMAPTSTEKSPEAPSVTTAPPKVTASEPASLQETTKDEAKPAPLLQEATMPARTAPATAAGSPPFSNEPNEHAQPSGESPPPEIAPAVVPTFTDRPQIN